MHVCVRAHVCVHMCVCARVYRHPHTSHLRQLIIPLFYKKEQSVRRAQVSSGSLSRQTTEIGGQVILCGFYALDAGRNSQAVNTQKCLQSLPNVLREGGQILPPPHGEPVG